jgi:hypothetical protein
MEGYNKVSVGPFKTVHFNDKVEAYMQGYSNGSVVPFMTVDYNG